MTIPSNEEIFALPTPDGKKIYGLLNKAEKPNGKVVIIAHGLTGHINEYLHLIARDFFTGRGYDVVRLSFYDDPEDARKLSECTIETHAQDLRQVFDHFSTLYKNCYVAGHSYAGLAMVISGINTSALSFWDCTMVPYEGFWKTNAMPLKGTNYYTAGWGCHNLINPDMIEKDQKRSLEETINLIKRVSSPSLVVLAENTDIALYREVLADNLTCPKKRVEIAGADHCFTKGQTVYALLNETYDWFENND